MEVLPNNKPLSCRTNTIMIGQQLGKNLLVLSKKFTQYRVTIQIKFKNHVTNHAWRSGYRQFSMKFINCLIQSFKITYHSPDYSKLYLDLEQAVAVLFTEYLLYLKNKIKNNSFKVLLVTTYYFLLSLWYTMNSKLYKTIHPLSLFHNIPF